MPVLVPDKTILLEGKNEHGGASSPCKTPSWHVHPYAPPDSSYRVPELKAGKDNWILLPLLKYHPFFPYWDGLKCSTYSRKLSLRKALRDLHQALQTPCLLSAACFKPSLLNMFCLISTPDIFGFSF